MSEPSIEDCLKEFRNSDALGSLRDVVDRKIKVMFKHEMAGFIEYLKLAWIEEMNRRAALRGNKQPDPSDLRL